MDRGSGMSLRFVTNERIAETSSKGNQEKWVDENHWYKLDQFGYGEQERHKRDVIVGNHFHSCE